MHEPRGLAEIEPRLIPIVGWLVHWNAVMRAHQGDTLMCPAVAMTRDDAIPVEDAAMTSSLAISTSWRTAAITSAAVLLS
jgi:hypothetical protein